MRTTYIGADIHKNFIQAAAIDEHGHDQMEYYYNNQPKWMVRIFGNHWYYCSDVCLNKHFHYSKRPKKYYSSWITQLFEIHKYKLNKYYGYYKKNPKAKFRLNLTKCYKINNR